MRFEARTFWLPKDAEETAQYQDAFAVDAETGRAAIADGVSSAIFSGPWACLLSLGAVAEPPPLDDTAAFQTWLAEKRNAWAASVDTSKLTWYQRPKMVDGAMTTLLWLELVPSETGADGLATRYQLRTFAIGDSCLFHQRAGELLSWFPLENSGQFGLNPAVVASVDRQLDHLLAFKAAERECLPGDLLVLATDALALWAVERQESGEVVDWSRYWDYSDDDWRGEIFALRDAKQMRFDDTTLVLLRVIEERPVPPMMPVELVGPEPATHADELPTDSVAETFEPAEALSSDAAVVEGPVVEQTVAEEAVGAEAVVEEAALEQAESLIEPEARIQEGTPIADDAAKGGDSNEVMPARSAGAARAGADGAATAEADKHVDDATSASN
ncbi:MAG TPA: hypothetical protein VHC22_25855 [Pirellulales bacterium]|nr:hypothetical protein [Pirellulales bacterium]